MKDQLPLTAYGVVLVSNVLRGDGEAAVDRFAVNPMICSANHRFFGFAEKGGFAAAATQCKEHNCPINLRELPSTKGAETKNFKKPLDNFQF